jgi:hypothetical protein
MRDEAAKNGFLSEAEIETEIANARDEYKKEYGVSL